MIITHSRRIVVCAGGTGGHVIPAIVVLIEFNAQGIQTKFVTDQRGFNYSTGYPLSDVIQLKVSKSPQNFLASIKFFCQLIQVTAQCVKCFKVFKPDFVLGYGGYPSIPGLCAALLLGIPIIIHEQNAILGRANRFFRRFVKYVLTSFVTTRGLQDTVTEYIGMPVRYQNKMGGISHQPKTTFNLTILGGSQGAKFLGELIPRALHYLSQELRDQIDVTHQVRADALEDVQALYPAGVTVQIASFFEDMERILSQSNLVIARAGASTIFEVIAFMAPTLFVPLPSAMDNHQYLNATQIRNTGGCWTIDQAQLSPQKLASFIQCAMENAQRLLPTQIKLKQLQQINVAQELVKKIFPV